MQATDNLHVLVVDDDPQALSLLSEVLGSLGLEANGIGDSRQAVEAVHQDRFDCIFLDLRMPEVDGLQLAREARQSLTNRHTPIVFVTGEQDRETMNKAFAAGGTFFLTKPAARPHLRSLIGVARAAMLDNRKKWNVVPMRGPVTCFTEDDCFEGTAVALSERSLRIESRSTVSLGATVLLSFAIPGGWHFSLAGTVTAHDNETTVIEFREVSRADQFRLRTFVRATAEHN